MSWLAQIRGKEERKMPVRQPPVEWKLSVAEEEIPALIPKLRKDSYPRPLDCPWTNDGYPERRQFRLSCRLGVCVIAVKLCGDF